mgnify:CR=1 FL=1
MDISDFDYDLPEERIAQTPLEPRDSARLMVLHPKEHTIEHRHFYELGDFLRSGDVLIFNDTRVIPARLIGARSQTGGKVEVFLLRQIDKDQWEVLVKPGKKARVGSVIQFGDELSCEIIADTDFGGRIVRFVYHGIFEEILDRLGSMPLPPYIHEKLADRERYQTVYAKENGSAAAPTAGLHFTKELLAQIEAKGVKLVYLTLHVGLGTFRPVSVDNLDDHEMHSEFYTLSEEAAATLREVKANGHRVIAVGTTSIRTLETIGNKFQGDIQADSGWTNIFIKPGYQWQIVDAFSTNFHLPKSTLVMLVSAFAGRDLTLKAYEHAIAERYRFFSFGDAMFIK